VTDRSECSSGVRDIVNFAVVGKLDPLTVRKCGWASTYVSVVIIGLEVTMDALDGVADSNES